MNEITKKVESILRDTFEDAMWEKPIIGIAAGDDEYFDFLKNHIGDFHWSPAEAFALKYGEDVSPKKLRVVAVVFPQREETKAAQSAARDKPSDRWAVSRCQWKGLMADFCKKAEEGLEKIGIRAAAIDLRDEFERVVSEKQGMSSSWSHRHAAYAAGLGTFGLSRGFISEKGIAVRLTTFILEADLDITARGERGPFDWCLYYSKGICGACIRRCPVRAIDEKRQGKDKCFANISKFKTDEGLRALISPEMNEEDYVFGCGLCQAEVPCMEKNPLRGGHGL